MWRSHDKLQHCNLIGLPVFTTADSAQPRNRSIVSRLSFVRGARDRLGTRLADTALSLLSRGLSALPSPNPTVRHVSILATGVVFSPLVCAGQPRGRERENPHASYMAGRMSCWPHVA